MSRRDQIIDLIRDVEHATASPERAADRIISLIFPETPEEGMVEAMADSMRSNLCPVKADCLGCEDVRLQICAAYTAYRKWWLG